MSPELPTANFISPVPSTKTWLLLLSLLTILLLMGSRVQQPARGAAPATLVGSPAGSARPVPAPLSAGHRVAVESSARRPQAPTAVAL